MYKIWFNIPPNIKKIVDTKIVHTSGKMFEQMFENTFKPCSHTESNTQNPNTLFKITIYCIKYTQNTKTLSKFGKVNRQFTPQHRHAQTFPDTHRVQNSGAHVLKQYSIFWFYYFLDIYCLYICIYILYIFFIYIYLY